MGEKANAFKAANALSPVVSGYVLEPDPSKPPKGVSYTLKNGKRFVLTPEDCREIEQPRWDLPA